MNGRDPGAERRRWNLRTVPEALARRYREEGHWDDSTLGATVAEGLARRAHLEFNVHSAVRPWSGTFGEVDRMARTLAGSLRRAGVGPGDVVMFQMPNWLEAGVTFWASAYLGAVVVPVVHFYGAKEVAYIIEATDPDVIVTADRFGHADFIETYAHLLADREGPLWLVAGETPAADLPQRAVSFEAMLRGEPIEAPATVDPCAPAIVAFTSGTTRDPKGVIHTHETIGFETRQLNQMFPGGGPAPITGAPVGHFIGMVNAFLVPLLRERPVNLVDVWDPATILRLMQERNLGVAGGATYFLTSLLDHPDFTDAHLANMPFAGLGGSTVPGAVMERLERMGIAAFRSYGSTEHPSITGCLLADDAAKRLYTDGRALGGVEVRLGADGEIFSRGPDCFMGYIDASMTPKVVDDQGWYRTGDVGVLDADGFLTITDRVSDVIIRGGDAPARRGVDADDRGGAGAPGCRGSGETEVAGAVGRGGGVSTHPLGQGAEVPAS